MIGSAILNLMYGDPSQNIGRALNPASSVGPNPNPGAATPPSPAPGAPSALPGAGGATPPQQNQPPMAPAAATQSPPDLASLYTQLYDRDRAANAIDRGTALMASAFGTAQQQHDMMNYAQNMPQADTIGAMSKGVLAQGELLKQQQEQTAIQEHARFMAGSAMMGQLLGTDDKTASWLLNDPTAFNEVMKTHLAVVAANQTPTETMKNVDAAMSAWATAHPTATPEQLAAQKSSLLTGILPGPAGEAMKVQAEDKQKFQDTALQDYTLVNSKLTDTENTVNQLLKNPDAVVSALTDVVPTTGPYAAWNPAMSQSTKDAAVLMNKLKAGLTAEGLSGVKNVRNLREFNTLGQAATGALDAANSKEQIVSALQTIKNKILDARATSELAVGHKLTGDLVGHGNRDLLDPNNPYYNGGSEEAKAATSSGGGGKTYTYNPKTGQLE